MAKIKTIYVCQQCAAQRPRWEGRCPECGAWNSFVEETQSATPKSTRSWHTANGEKTSGSVLKLDQPVEQQNLARQKTGYGELDRVLGGGLVAGSYILLGGDPGVGKSTLLMQMAGGLAQNQARVLYVTAEESVQQTALRAHRLNVQNGNIQVASESCVEKILDLAKKVEPQVLIVDSIQTVYCNEITAAPGSVSQVRESAGHLMGLAKGRNMAVFIIGHVTKDGHIAGPKVLEHMVDTVLSFEGDINHQFRLLRALKNRFGATNELGVFQMESEGLEEVSNPSELFLEERGEDPIGSSIFTAIEGSRPLLCEVQALATSSPLAMPRRTTLGFDQNRVHLLIAVLDKHLDTELSRSDVFVNVVGGLKITEPAADLSIAASLLSTSEGRALSTKTCFFGEIGLTGEIRAVRLAEDRIREALKLGFQNFVLPHSNQKNLKTKSFKSANFSFVKHVRDLPSVIFSAQKKSSQRDAEIALDL